MEQNNSLQHTQSQVIGIMGAEAQEVEGILRLLDHVETTTFANRDYHRGQIHGQEVVVVHARVGKVAAATTVTALIHQFHITKLIFTGVAGGLHADLHVGDVVISSRLVQHDVDVRPFRPQFELPILGITYFEPDETLREQALQAAQRAMQGKSHDLVGFVDRAPKVIVGDIASGDQFISSATKRDELLAQLPSVQCVEMEGAAVAQVCHEYGIPFVVIRTISDAADDSASVDFQVFLEEVASNYSRLIVDEMLRSDCG